MHSLSAIAEIQGNILQTREHLSPSSSSLSRYHGGEKGGHLELTRFPSGAVLAFRYDYSELLRFLALALSDLNVKRSGNKNDKEGLGCDERLEKSKKCQLSRDEEIEGTWGICVAVGAVIITVQPISITFRVLV